MMISTFAKTVSVVPLAVPIVAFSSVESASADSRCGETQSEAWGTGYACLGDNGQNLGAIRDNQPGSPCVRAEGQVSYGSPWTFIAQTCGDKVVFNWSQYTNVRMCNGPSGPCVFLWNA